MRDTGRDDAVCGDCPLKSPVKGQSRCYVTLVHAPHAVWRAWTEGYYDDASGRLTELGTFRRIRIGAYGDPAAVPFEVWHALLSRARSWSGYTHQWRTCDQRFQRIVMASVESEADARAAQQLGWRTFRIRPTIDAPVMGSEFICPASDEAGFRTTCMECRQCSGTTSKARSVVIVAHGQPRIVNLFKKASDTCQPSPNSTT